MDASFPPMHLARLRSYGILSDSAVALVSSYRVYRVHFPVEGILSHRVLPSSAESPEHFYRVLAGGPLDHVLQRLALQGHAELICGPYSEYSVLPTS